jgi:purine-nucleoside phosphorylase
MPFKKSQAAADFIRSKTKLQPKIGLVLGSGLGAFAEDFTDAVRIPFGDIPHFPTSTAVGHAGKLVVGKVGDVPVAAMQGRVHFYEGYSMTDVIFPIRVLKALGIKAAIVTNAAGGINLDYKQGALMVMKDHINMQGTNPLVGHNDENFGPRFFDMTFAYEPKYRQWALAAGKGLTVKVHEGVYLAVTGPSYETPAEIRAFRTLGADVVGMSTVPEVIAARHMDIKVLAISCITNLAAGVSPVALNHEEVLETGRNVRADFVALLQNVIPQIAKDVA